MFEILEEGPFGNGIDVQVTRKKGTESRDMRKMIRKALICGD
jgi:hypothetical protein